jgi:sugar-specific transcriptional regulator TrmB
LKVSPGAGTSTRKLASNANIIELVLVNKDPGSLMYWQDEQFSKFCIELNSYGLTVNQGKIYLYLLKRPGSAVRSISKALGLHRVDVYRKVHELEDLGMVEVLLDNPRTYVASDPKTLLLLLRKQEDGIKRLKQRTGIFLAKLEEYRHSASRLYDETSRMVSSYRLVVGRSKYLREIKTMIQNANTEVLRIVSAEGIIRTFSSKVVKEYAKARSRGVVLRMISEVNSQNRAYAKRISKIVDLRHLDNVHLRFMVVDKSTSVITGRYDEKSMSLDALDDNYLVVKDPKFAETCCFFFEHLWSVASETHI